MLTATIRFGIIFLSLSCYCHLQKLCSSYFTFSYVKKSHEDSHSIAEYQADTEIACALRCSTKVNCEKATFNSEFKKCSLYQMKDKGPTGFNTRNDNSGQRTVTLRKVSIPPNKSNKDCPFADDKSTENTNAVQGENTITGTSCSDILRKNSSSPNGHYRITIGNVTWKTRCKMNGVRGCGRGVWELVMRVNGSRSTFSFDSHHWTNKAAYLKAVNKEETKLPGYWLRNFTKICVTMQFPANASRNATSLLVNHTAQSLHSVLHDGVKKTFPIDLSTIKTPPNVHKNCLIQGFNMLGPHPWEIKSRVGVESQPVQWCPIPYLVRGVGIGFQGTPAISCGEVIISYSNPHGPTRINAFPAFCVIYIQ